MKIIHTHIPDKKERDRVYGILEALGIRSNSYSALEFGKSFPNSDYVGFIDEKLDGWHGIPSVGRAMNVEKFLIEAVKIAPKKKPIEIKLNDSYTAIVTKEGTKVGCQTFDNARILEVAARIKELAKPKLVQAQAGDVITREFRFKNFKGSMEEPLKGNLGRTIDRYDRDRWFKPEGK